MITFLFKFLAAAALMVGLYWLIMRKKASYKANRIYLLTVPMMSILMSTLSFEVYTADTDLMAENILPEIKIEKRTPLKNDNAAINSETSNTLYTIHTADETPAVSSPNTETNWTRISGYTIFSVSAILVLVALAYIAKINTIRSRMKSEPTAEGYRMVKSMDIKTPFSFQKTIFMPANLDEGSERLIVSHEKAHIAHRHYVDVIVSEFATRILWFNPFLWIARNELRNVHEFEADHEVITKGANIKNYQTTLLEMVLNENTPVVSGFNQSFIRRRFIEMRKSTAGTLGHIGKALSAVCLTGLFCAFTFTSCKSNAAQNTEGSSTIQPGWFVIKGTADKEISDSAYNVYLGDKYQHLSKEPDTSVVVTNKKWEYKVYLEAPRAGKVAAIFPGGSVCEATIAFTAIPGDTLCLNVHNGFYDTEGTGEKFYRDAKDALTAMRESTDGKTPYLPEIKSEKMWKNVGYKKGSHSICDAMTIKLSEVYFTDSATILKLTTNDATGNVVFGKRYKLMDPNGNEYKFMHTVLSDPTDNWNKEARVYGDYIYFEPLPMDTKEFSVAIDGIKNLTTLWENIHDKTGEAAPEPNVTIKLSVDSDVNVGSLKLYDQTENTYINEASLGKNQQKKIKAYVDRRESGLLEITRDNNETSQYYIEVWASSEFEIIIHKDDVELNGESGYYKNWNEAYNLYKKTLNEKGKDKAKETMREFLLDCVGTGKAEGAFECIFNTLKLFDGDEAYKLIEEINKIAREKHIKESASEE